MQNRVLIAAAVTAIVVIGWYALRWANTQNIYDQMGISQDDLAAYSGSDSWNYGPNWDGYEIGDPIPETVKN
jgi:hypothetical protein